MKPAVTTTASRPAAFLDRDGVVNMDTGYAYKPEHLVLTPTAAEGIRLLNEAGYLVIVVTNQSGVARGLFTEADVHAFHAHLQKRLAEEGGRIDAFYHCPYYRGGTVAAYAVDHEDRKPRPGMLLRAMRDWPIRKAGSFMIGDKQRDADAATAAGISSVLVPTDVEDLAAVVRRQLGRAI